MIRAKHSSSECAVPETTVFRSLLPHEPHPRTEIQGYLHIQGALEPKKVKQTKGDAKEPHSQHVINGDDEVDRHWTQEAFREALESSVVVKNAQGLETIEILDKEPPFTKVRLVFCSPNNAWIALQAWRSCKLSAHDIFSCPSSNPSEFNSQQYTFSVRPLQITQVTQQPMLPTFLAWTRSNPPKFRRLLQTESNATTSLEEDRASARFVVVSNLFPVLCDSVEHLGLDTIVVTMRQLAEPFDSTGYGVEVFVPFGSVTPSYCHIGMRCPADAQRLIRELQGVTVRWTRADGAIASFSSPPLFLDYATITPLSAARSRRTDGLALERGEPSRSECTSTTDSVLVPGLSVLNDFVSPEEEQVLLSVLLGPQAPWAPSQVTPSQTGAVKRRVQHYGYVFDYETANVLRDRTPASAACPPMPAIPIAWTESLVENIDCAVQQGQGWEVLAGVTERTRRHLFDGKQTFCNINQMTINEYRPGEGIGSHIDTPSAFGDGIMSLSLNSGIVMEFRDTKSNQKKLVYLPPRSLLVMTGAARYEWEHHIVTRRTDTHNGVVKPRGLRVSLTLRTALEAPENGAMPLARVESHHFPLVWGHEASNTKNVLQTPETERQHVHAVYDAVATQWHHTRGKRGVLWPGATRFLQELPKGSIVADVGCGDGKYFPAILEAGSYAIGTDISLPLLQTCNFGTETAETRQVSSHRLQLRNRPAVVCADCMMLPLKDRSVDAAICIAVLHHLSTIERRLQCLHELVRIVKPGGWINVQAWAMEQEEGSRRKFASTDVFVPFNAQPKYLDKAQGLAPGGTDAAPISNSGISSVAQLYSENYKGAEYDECKGLVIFQRYCHLYRQGELESLAGQLKGVQLVECGYETGNHFMILRVL